MTTKNEYMTRMGTDALETIRKELVVRFIRESEDASELGWTIENNQLIESEPCTEGVFPDSLHGNRHELIYYLDSVYKALLENEHVKSTCGTMKSKSELEAVLTTPKSKLPLYANWRIACSEYLHMLAKSSEQTFGVFVADENPYVLVGAIMALNRLYDNTGDYTANIGKLLAIHKRMHAA